MKCLLMVLVMIRGMVCLLLITRRGEGGGSAPEPVIDDFLAGDEQEVSVDVLVRELEELLTERERSRYRLVHIPMGKDEHGRWLDQYGSRFNKGPPSRPP